MGRFTLTRRLAVLGWLASATMAIIAFLMLVTMMP